MSGIKFASFPGRRTRRSRPLCGPYTKGGKIVNSTTTKSSVITQVLFSAVAIVLGYLLLFNKSVQVLTLCQILCGGLVIAGIVSIASFFVSGDYKRIDRYGFTIGVLLILLGCIGLLRVNDLTQHFDMYTGLLALVLGVLTLQGTVQVKVLDYAIWVISLIISIVCIAGSFCVLSEISAITGLVQGFSSWVLLICGVSCIFSLIVTWICILLAGRREKKAKQEELFARIEPGMKVTGVVKNVTDFGAFIDLGGADGLLHISEMSWGRVESPKKLFTVGQELEVLIKNIQDEKIALTLKFPETNPWLNADEKYAKGNVVTGKVARMTDFGAFIELEPGVDALLHVSQIAKEHVDKPSDVLSVGQEIEAMVVDFKQDEHKISLSRKALEAPAPAAEEEAAEEE